MGILKSTGPKIDQKGRNGKPPSTINGEIGKMVKWIRMRGELVEMLKHAGPEIGTNGKNCNANKCAKMVILVK